MRKRVPFDRSRRAALAAGGAVAVDAALHRGPRLHSPTKAQKPASELLAQGTSAARSGGCGPRPGIRCCFRPAIPKS